MSLCHHSIITSTSCHCVVMASSCDRVIIIMAAIFYANLQGMAAMVAEVRGVFGTLTYPYLILPYSTHYGHLASHYEGPWCSPTAWWCNKKHLKVPKPPIYVKMVGLTVLSMLIMGSLHTKPPPYDFLNLYGACLHAPRTSKVR